jgi:uncharacterized membrane protein YukC
MTWDMWYVGIGVWVLLVLVSIFIVMFFKKDKSKR